MQVLRVYCALQVLIGLVEIIVSPFMAGVSQTGWLLIGVLTVVVNVVVLELCNRVKK
jgi:hypothetical protein